MKYILIPYIALGLVLSLAIGIEYRCEGPEMFPAYYGSPFVFKKQSLGSSMEYFYSISGLIANTVVWSLGLFFVDKLMKIYIGKMAKPKLTQTLYHVAIGMMIAFSTLNIAMEFAMTGRGFKPELNYWYWNMDQAAKDWGVMCKGEIMMFSK